MYRTSAVSELHRGLHFAQEKIKCTAYILLNNTHFDSLIPKDVHDI